MKQYQVEIKDSSNATIGITIADDAMQAAEWMESKLADLPDGYLGHIQVIGGGDGNNN